MGETDVTDVNPLVLTKTPESPDSTKLMAYEQLFLAPGWPRGQRLNRLSEPIQVKCALDTGCVLIDGFLIVKAERVILVDFRLWFEPKSQLRAL